MSRRVLLALAALVVLDVVLMVLAFRHVDDPWTVTASDPSRSHASESGAASGDARSDPGPSQKSTGPSPSAGAGAPEAAEGSSMVSELSRAVDLLVVAVAGDCTSDEPVRVRTSAGDGSEPTETTLPGVQAVGSVSITGPATATLVGATDACKRVTLTTTDGGESWEPDPEADVWGLVPGRGGSSVVSPDGADTVPCRATSLAGFNADVAHVGCSGGQILRTASAGAAWAEVGRLDADVAAFAWPDPTTVYALVRPPRGCELAVRKSTDGGRTFAPAVCTGLPDADVVTLAASGEQVYVTSRSATAVSLDGGTTFAA